MKNLDTLPHDIYDLLQDLEVADGVDLNAECQRFGAAVADVLLGHFQPKTDTRKLRLSGLGKPDRQIYHSYHSVGSGPGFSGPTLVKFMYGHVIEELLLALTRLSGHTVEDEQKEVHVEGIKGHQDARIDGVLVDVKSCSSFAYKKFQQNKLHEDDVFGYVGQLKSYAHAQGDKEYAWVAMDKQGGNICVLHYNEQDKDADYAEAVDWDAGERARHIKTMVESDIIPAVCYEPIPDGKSGNEKLATGCVYCSYRDKCWPEARPYRYSNGTRYLTKVVKEPRVEQGEIPSDF